MIGGDFNPRNGRRKEEGGKSRTELNGSDGKKRSVDSYNYSQKTVITKDAGRGPQDITLKKKNT